MDGAPWCKGARHDLMRSAAHGFAALALAACARPPRTVRVLALCSSSGSTHSSESLSGADFSSGSHTDAEFMHHALAEAEKAFASREVPIGAVLVRNGEVVAAARNRVEELRDASAHAELLCMRTAAQEQSTWRLNALGPSTLYVTLEPCPMCLAALHAFRVDRLVYAAPNERMGAIESSLRAQAPATEHPYHTLDITGGVLAEPAAELMRAFFRERRKRGPWVPPELVGKES